MDITSLFSSTMRHLVNILYPPRCLICDGAGSKERDLCEPCERALPWIRIACVRCALPLPGELSDSLICGRCLKKLPFFDDSLSLFSFEKEIVGLIHKLKFHDNLAVARLFSHLMAETIVQKTDKPDCLLAVPLYKKRLRLRGFNQSIEVSRALGKAWGIPLENNRVRRLRETQPQTGLDAKQRRKNIKGAFEVVGLINYKHIAIIDDVVTTGSTVNELARLLKRNGVERVSVYSVARAPIK